MARPSNDDRENVTSAKVLIRMLNRQLDAGMSFTTQDIRDMLDEIEKDSRKGPGSSQPLRTAGQ